MNYTEIQHSLHENGDGRPQSNYSTTIANASSVVNTIATVANSDNPTINNAMKVLGILSDVGKALPYVAPAFILLKIIVDLEKNAVDVDAKCNDLIERIIFMVSHLPVLLKVDVMASTQQVIDRMNKGITDAAALIAAYRKQGRVARRLSLTNRDKFIVCAETINQCSRDLLMSLQIHQTTQLDILTREVPIDDDDQAAKLFIEAHGGSSDTIVHDRELVRKFARQRHLVMDDPALEQLNTDLAESVRQYHVRLEGLLKDTVSRAIKDGFKNLATDMLLMEAEQKFRCIQCDQEFTEHSNGPKSCSFHRAEYIAMSKCYPCCSTAHPCQFGTHRSKHHCEYPYGAFFARCRGVLRGPGTREEWVVVDDTNLETNAVQTASVSQLFRWAPLAGDVDDKTLLIIVGQIGYKHPYYFDTFTARQLEEMTKSGQLSHRELIFRTSASKDEFAQAEWVLSASGDITGIRLTVKAATSTSPHVRICPVDPTKCTKPGNIITVSEGGLRTYTPAEPYMLPQTIRFGPELSSDQTRPVRTDFKTTTTPSLNVILKVMSDPPLAANPTFAHHLHDHFHGTVSVFNDNPAASAVPVVISDVRAEYRLVGQDSYVPVKACKLTEGAKSLLPYSIDPGKSWQINFEATLPRTDEDAKLLVKWWNRAFMARYQPVRIKLILEDIRGEECSLVFEHVFRQYPYEKAKVNDLGFVFFDNPVTLERHFVHVDRLCINGGVVRIGHSDIKEQLLNRAVYQALESGETEIDLGIGVANPLGRWRWDAYALVDASCCRVYAFKIIIQEGEEVSVKRFGSQGYVLCPDYGEPSNSVRPISYAKEVAKPWPTEPYIQPEYPQDDTVDDFDPLALPKTIPLVSGEEVSLSNGINGHAMPPELDARLGVVETRLASIEARLERIVDALEKLSGMGRIS